MIGATVGLLIGLIIVGLTVPEYIRATHDPSRYEILEGGVLLAAVVGYPTSMGLTWVTDGGFPMSWIAFILVAPMLNFGLIGMLFGGLLACSPRA